MQEETNAAEAVTEEVMPVEGEAQEVETPEQPQHDPETVEFARMIGWKAPDEWQGEKPPGYIEDPQQYVERAKTILPFRKLEEQFTSLQQTFDKRLGGIESAYQAAMERQKEQQEHQIKALQARQSKAFDEGDKETFEAARQAEERLRQQSQPEQPKPQAAEIPPEVRSALDNWRVDNDWFGQDQERTQAASQAWTQAEGMGITDPNAILKFVDKTMAQKFPPKQPERKTAAFEEGLTIGGNVEGFSKLPNEAKQAFKRMVKQGLFTDDKAGRAQYVADYEG